MFNNDEKRLNMNSDNVPYIDTISARDLVNMMYSAGLIEMPYLDSDTLLITSCPIDPDYTLRDDLPAYSPNLSLRAETCVTDYDTSSGVFDDDDPVLNPNDRITTRIAITLGDD